MSLDRFTVTRAGRTSVVNVGDIDWIESGGNYVSLPLGPRRGSHRSVVTLRVSARQEPGSSHPDTPGGGGSFPSAGVEDSPGVKNPDRIVQFFASLRRG